MSDEIRVGIIPSADWELDISYKDRRGVLGNANYDSEIARQIAKKPQTIKAAQGIWCLLKEELTVLLTQKTNDAIYISALKPYRPDDEIDIISLSYEDYHNHSNIIRFQDLVITKEQLTKAKKFFYNKDAIEKETDPKHLEKICQLNNDLINAIHSKEPYGDLEKEKSMHCSSTTDYQALISSLKQLLICFAGLDPKKLMKNGKPIQGDNDRGVVSALIGIEDFQIKGKTTLQNFFREAMNKD